MRSLFVIITFLFCIHTQAKQTIVRSPAELLEAINNVNPGDSLLLRGGVYKFDKSIRITRSGDSLNRVYMIADPSDGTRPRFDFSEMKVEGTNRGIDLRADYWHIKGIDVFKAGDNGMWIGRAHHNIIEFCTFSECSDTGLQLGQGASFNIILNCDSYFNADPTLENADGFACKTDVGTDNKFVGCRSWYNLDDGWDGYLRGSDSITTTYERCWAISNGFTKNDVRGKGDGNGFKTGGSDEKNLKHNAIIINCIAAGNGAKGFDQNNNRGSIILSNCGAHDNAMNYGFNSKVSLTQLLLYNSVSVGEVGETKALLTDITNNSWQNGIKCSSKDFVSLDMKELLKPREKDGSLPEISYMHLVKDSDLIDKGTEVGLPFNGAAPDIGPFEYK